MRHRVHARLVSIPFLLLTLGDNLLIDPDFFRRNKLKE